MKLSLSTLYIRKKWNIILTEFAWTRIPSSRSPEKWVEIRWSTKKYIAWMLPGRSRRRAPERPWDRPRPSRTIYKPAVPTSSPGTLVFFRNSPAPLFAALRLPILYAAPHFKDEFARNFFHELRVSQPLHRPDAERNCGGKRREAASSYRDWILFLHGACY